jgi:hypothetical protein
VTWIFIQRASGSQWRFENIGNDFQKELFDCSGKNRLDKEARMDRHVSKESLVKWVLWYLRENSM